MDDEENREEPEREPEKGRKRKPNKRRRKLLGMALSAFSIIILSYIAITLITGQESVFTHIADLFRPKMPVVLADDLFFDVGRHKVYANLGGSIAAAGTLGAQVLDRGGAETLRDPLRLSAPAIDAAGAWAIAFDIGGTAVRTFTESRVSASVGANGEIVSASINGNGWFAVCTQEGASYRSIVTAYDNGGGGVYRVSLATGYALRAALSPDNGRLAILSLTDNGSRLAVYGLDSEEPEFENNYPGDLILDIRYLPGGEILAVSTRSLIVIQTDGSASELFGFDGGRLGGYTLSDSVIALHLLDYGIGYSGRIITLDPGGKLLGGILTDKAVLSMSANGGYLAVLKSDGPAFYDPGMNEYMPTRDLAAAAGATQVLSLGEGAFLVAGDHLAEVFTIGGRGIDDSGD